MQTEKMTLTIAQAALLSNVSKQAVYVALLSGRLKAYKSGSRWRIEKEDLWEYRRNLYSRMKSKYQGEYIYQPENGIISIRESGRIAEMDYHKIYYFIRNGRLKASRKGCAWVIHRADLDEFIEAYNLGFQAKA